MKKYVFKSSIVSLILGCGALMTPCITTAAVPSSTDECAKELLLSYFPEPIVAETLRKFNVSQDKWAGIQRSLSSKDKEIVKLVEQKAASMNPNPLKDPQQRQTAVKLFRETLLQVFSDALKENGVEDSGQYQAMLDDVQQQKAKKFAMCMEQKRAQMKPAGSTVNADHDDDNDDNDHDDNDDDDSDGKIKMESTEPDYK